MKKIIICSDKSHQNEIRKITTELSKENLIFMPIIISENTNIIEDIYLKKLELIDTLVVINKDNYINSSINKIIEIAKSINKDIIYYTDLIK